MFNFLHISFTVAISQDDVTLESDDPYMRVQVSEEVVLKCCFTTKKSVKYTWVRSFQSDKKMIGPKHIKNGTAQGKDVSQCGYLKLESVKLNDSGLYQCQLKYNEDILTHGTYLQIYSEYINVCVLAHCILYRCVIYVTWQVVIK